MIDHKLERQVVLLKILAKGCKKHPAYRAIRKATERCEECVVVWQARVKLNEMEANSINHVDISHPLLSKDNLPSSVYLVNSIQ